MVTTRCSAAPCRGRRCCPCTCLHRRLQREQRSGERASRQGDSGARQGSGERASRLSWRGRCRRGAAVRAGEGAAARLVEGAAPEEPVRRRGGRGALGCGEGGGRARGCSGEAPPPAGGWRGGGAARFAGRRLSVGRVGQIIGEERLCWLVRKERENGESSARENGEERSGRDLIIGERRREKGGVGGCCLQHSDARPKVRYCSLQHSGASRIRASLLFE